MSASARTIPAPCCKNAFCPSSSSSTTPTPADDGRAERVAVRRPRGVLRGLHASWSECHPQTLPARFGEEEKGGNRNPPCMNECSTCVRTIPELPAVVMRDLILASHILSIIAYHMIHVAALQEFLFLSAPFTPPQAWVHLFLFFGCIPCLLPQ